MLVLFMIIGVLWGRIVNSPELANLYDEVHEEMFGYPGYDFQSITETTEISVVKKKFQKKNHFYTGVINTTSLFIKGVCNDYVYEYNQTTINIYSKYTIIPEFVNSYKLHEDDEKILVISKDCKWVLTTTDQPIHRVYELTSTGQLIETYLLDNLGGIPFIDYEWISSVDNDVMILGSIYNFTSLSIVQLNLETGEFNLSLPLTDDEFDEIITYQTLPWPSIKTFSNLILKEYKISGNILERVDLSYLDNEAFFLYEINYDLQQCWVVRSKTIEIRTVTCEEILYSHQYSQTPKPIDNLIYKNNELIWYDGRDGWILNTNTPEIAPVTFLLPDVRCGVVLCDFVWDINPSNDWVWAFSKDSTDPTEQLPLYKITTQFILASTNIVTTTHLLNVTLAQGESIVTDTINVVPTCGGSRWGDSCEEWHCFGMQNSGTSTCGEQGRCVSPDICKCPVTEGSSFNNDCSCSADAEGTFCKIQPEAADCSFNDDCSTNECTANDDAIECLEQTCYFHRAMKVNELGSSWSYCDWGDDGFWEPCQDSEPYYPFLTGCCADLVEAAADAVFQECMDTKSWEAFFCDVSIIQGTCMSECNGLLSNNQAVCGGSGECYEGDCKCQINLNSHMNITDCSCEDPWVGPSCDELQCHGIDPWDSTVCNSNGVCVSGECNCLTDEEFRFNSSDCSCISPYTGTGCQDHTRCLFPSDCNEGEFCSTNDRLNACSTYLAEYSKTSCYNFANTAEPGDIQFDQCCVDNICDQSCCVEKMLEVCDTTYQEDIATSRLLSYATWEYCMLLGATHSNSYDIYNEGGACLLGCNGSNPIDPLTCVGSNECIDGICQCDINEFSHYENLITCECTTPYIGQHCDQLKCGEFAPGEYGVCDNRGECVHGVCQCEGPNLQNMNLTTCECVAGVYGVDCDIYTCEGIVAIRPDVCMGRGECVGVDTCECALNYTYHDNNCRCDEGVYGSGCEIFECFGVLNNYSSVCSGNGVCGELDTCLCESPYFGQSCYFYNPFNTIMFITFILIGVAVILIFGIGLTCYVWQVCQNFSLSKYM